MPLNPKNDNDAPEPYRRYRVPEPTVPEETVDEATAGDDGVGTCAVLVGIGVSLFSILFYLSIFGVIAWVIASMLGLVG